jgi:hypothetical protein
MTSTASVLVIHIVIHMLHDVTPPWWQAKREVCLWQVGDPADAVCLGRMKAA